MLIRPATHSDVPSIGEWTTDTFPWGDYLSRVLDDWIDADDSQVLVAEIDGAVVGVTRAVIVGPGEAWAQGARVHPEHRRQGIGSAIGAELWDWARARGASVVRLSVEGYNESARKQVQAMGFRKVSNWWYGSRAIGESSPVPEGNGGQRVPPPERLEPAHSAEAEAAFLSWSGGDLSRAARQLAPTDWRWGRQTVQRLVEAAKRRDFFGGRPGWAVVVPTDESLWVEWLETAESDAQAMVLALIDLAAATEIDTIEVLVPAVDWLSDQLVRYGFELHDLGIYALAL